MFVLGDGEVVTTEVCPRSRPEPRKRDIGNTLPPPPPAVDRRLVRDVFQKKKSAEIMTLPAFTFIPTLLS